jgi:hypothetical protein
LVEDVREETKEGGGKDIQWERKRRGGKTRRESGRKDMGGPRDGIDGMGAAGEKEPVKRCTMGESRRETQETK